jgi:hypothetical protein
VSIGYDGRGAGGKSRRIKGVCAIEAAQVFPNIFLFRARGKVLHSGAKC